MKIKDMRLGDILYSIFYQRHYIVLLTHRVDKSERVLLKMFGNGNLLEIDYQEEEDFILASSTLREE